MSAIELKNLTEIPATVPIPLIQDKSKSVIHVSQAVGGFEGEGFPVKRAFAGIDLSLLDPFIMMDEI